MPDADPPPPPNPPAKAAEVDLGGLDPGELLARGLHTVKPSVGASAWEPPSPAELGKLLPGYRIESLIGRGGMGAVYKGEQLNLERSVAIKLLPAEIATDAGFVDRFKREARTLARLQHSRIVTIHDFGQTTQGHLFFVMEYIDGTDLRRILKGPGLDPEQALAVVGQLCDALQAAHREGIVHRDIKPENVLITKDGYVKLADFGLSRPPQDDDSPQLTDTNMVMGTANYMAPEQQDGAAKADHRSDIFALGVMFYEMLTGHTPRGVFDPPSRKLQIDVRIDEVVLKALQSEPERRYQQVSEMKTDVDRIRSTPLPARTPAKPAGKAPKPPKPPKPAASGRKSGNAGLIAAVMGVLVLMFAGYFLWHTGGQWSSVQSGPMKATKEAPFVNSLGMKFVPVSGTDVLFSIWDTRVQDYAEYARSNGDTVDGAWQSQNFEGAPVSRDPDYPVVGVSWTDANAFCQWLTRKESAAGKLPKGMVYRLPTDLEWSAAAGLPHEDGETPKERSIASQSQYPWGGGFPPMDKTGNFGDETMRAAFPSRPNFIRGYTDGFAATSPVGSFPADSFGLYDLSGNVWQWCEDRFEPEQDGRVLRGSSFVDSGGLFAANRTSWGSGARNSNGGFRCVLAMREPDRKSTASPASTSPPSSPPGIRLFNGHDLTGWRTVGDTWSVHDGAIVCQPSDQWAPLVWKDGTVADFELNCKYRANRSFDKKYWYGAIRFRDQITNATTLGMTGPLAQVELNLGGTGNIVEPGGRDLLAFRGERSFLVNGGPSHPAAVYVPGSVSGFSKAVASYQANDWNDYRIVAVGKQIQIFLNGSLMTESLDATSVAAKEGVLALMNGPLQFKDIFLKEIKGAPPVDLSLPLPLEPPAKAGGVKLRYVQEGSMAPKKAGARDFANVTQITDDPNAVLEARPVYFDQQTGHQVYYEVESSTPLTELYFTGSAFYDFRIEILDHQSGVTTSSGPYNGGNTRRTIRMPLPNLTHFQIALRSHAGSWFLVEDLHFGAASTGGTAVVSSRTTATTTAASGAASIDAAGWISLMPNIDPAADAVTGEWTRVGEELRGAGIAGKPGPSVLQLPYEPPQEYDFRIAFTTWEGGREATQVLSAMGRQFRWGTGTGNVVKWAGFAVVNGKNIQDSPAAVKLSEFPLLNHRYESLVEVRRDHVTAYVDGRKIVDWPTNYQEMRIEDIYRLRDPLAIGVGIWQSKTTFHDISVREVTGKGKLLREAPPAPSSTAVPAATKDAPFINTLGMKFVSIPILGGATGGQPVLFSIWKTRVQDYAAFVADTGRHWSKPRFEQGPTHPVVSVNWDDAEAFCGWLTAREHKSGQLAATELYRLPTDHEWSCAAGIGDREDPAKLPSEKSSRVNEYPWGDDRWPPPAGAGNYSGEETKGHEIWGNQQAIAGYRDVFPETSPVGSFTANRLGLFDLGGNAWEWCDDWFDQAHSRHVLRGGSFACYFRDQTLLSFRRGYEASRGDPDDGFRIVKATSTGDSGASAGAPSAAPSSSAAADRVWAMSVGLHTPAPGPSTTPAVQPATPTPASIPAADKDALEKALLAHPWTWKPVGSASYPWTEVVFWRDGSMTTSTPVMARWTITGLRSVALQFSTGERLNLTFHFGFDYFAGARADGQDVVNGWVKMPGSAAAEEKPAATPAATSTKDPMAALTQGLTGASWTCLRLLSADRPWTEQRFYPTGAAASFTGGSLDRSGHWQVTGPLSLKLQNIPDGATFFLTFNPTLTAFDERDAAGNVRYRGTRQAPAAATPLPSPAFASPPMTTTPAASPTPSPGIQSQDTTTMRQIVDLQFAHGPNGFPTGSFSKWQLAVINGEYQMVLHDAGVWFLGSPMVQNLRLHDFVCEVRGRIVRAGDGGWGLGLVKGSGADHPWTGVMIDSRSAVSSHTYDNGPDLPWLSTAAMLPGRMNTLRVEAVGSRIRAFVNGVFVLERQHERLQPDSSLTLYCFGDHPPEEVRVQSIQVWVPR